MRARTAGHLILVAILAIPGTATAACLLNDYSVRAEYDRSLMVLTGKVVAERTVPESGRRKAGQSLDVFSENSSGRFPMQPSESYLLFIHLDTDRLAVDNCGNSGPVSARAETLRAVRALASRQRGGQKPNKPLERPGVEGRLDVGSSSAGRSAPS